MRAAKFIAIIGPEAIQIFNNFNPIEEEKKDIATRKRKFESYFSPNINVSFERYNFFNAVQKEDEFLTSMRTQKASIRIIQLPTQETKKFSQGARKIRLWKMP